MAALFHTLEAAAQDDAAELAEALITDLVKDAEAADKKARLRSLRDLDDAAILLRDMAKLVFEERRAAAGSMARRPVRAASPRRSRGRDGRGRCDRQAP